MSGQEIIIKIIYHLVRIYWPLIASQIRRKIQKDGIDRAVKELKAAIYVIENSEGMTDEEKNDRLILAGAHLIGLRKPKDAKSP